MSRASINKYGQTKVSTNLTLPAPSIERLNQWARSLSTSRSEVVERLVRGLFQPHEVDPQNGFAPVLEGAALGRINVTLTPDCIAKLDGWARGLGTHRSDMCDRLVTGQFLINDCGTPVHHEGQFQLQLEPTI